VRIKIEAESLGIPGGALYPTVHQVAGPSSGFLDSELQFRQPRV
jgi:hypothetical protein